MAGYCDKCGTYVEARGVMIRDGAEAHEFCGTPLQNPKQKAPLRKPTERELVRRRNCNNGFMDC